MGYFNSLEFMNFLIHHQIVLMQLRIWKRFERKKLWSLKPHLFSDGASLKKGTQRKRKACNIEVESPCRCIPFLFSIHSSNDIQTSPPPPHPHSPWNFWHIKSLKAFRLQRAGLSDCTRRARCGCDRIHLHCSACAPIRYSRHSWSTHALPILNATQLQCHVPPTSQTDTQIHSNSLANLTHCSNPQSSSWMWPPRFDLSQIQFPKQLKILSILKAQETPQSANNPNSPNPLKNFLNHLQPLKSDSMFTLSLSFSNFPNPTPQKAQTLQKMCQKDQPSKLQKPKSKSQATQSANNPSSTNPLKLSLNDLQPLQIRSAQTETELFQFAKSNSQSSSKFLQNVPQPAAQSSELQ